MFEREVTDIMTATLATLVLFMITLSPTKTTIISVQQYLLALMIILNFLHMILCQLNRLSQKDSSIGVILNAILLVVTVVLFIIDTPAQYEGFWSMINNGYIYIIVLSFVFITFFIYDSKEARMVYQTVS